MDNAKVVYTCSNCRKVSSAREALDNLGNCPGCGQMLGRSATATPPVQASGSDPPSETTNYDPPKRGANKARTDGPPDEIVALKITPVQGAIRELQAITQLINTLAAVASPLAFELAGTNMERFVIVRCRRQDVDMVKGQITGIYGSPEIQELNAAGDPASVFTGGRGVRAFSRLVLSRPIALPIRTYRELNENDSILNLLGPLYGLEENEAGVIQLLVHEQAPEDWAAKYTRELLEMRRRRLGEISFVRVLQLLSIMAGLLMGGAYILIGQWLTYLWVLIVAAVLAGVGFPSLFRNSDIQWSETMEEMVLRKIEQPGYKVEIRLGVVARDDERVRKLLQTLIGAFRVFALESGNSFVPIQNPAPFLPGNFKKQNSAVTILGDVELATIWHLPLEELPDMLNVKKFTHRLPDATSFYSDGPTWHIGHSSKSAGPQIPMNLPISTVSRQHAILLGMTRMGKSTALEHMIRAVAKDPERSLVVVDPHSDLVHRLLRLLPAERANDVHFLDFANDTQVPGLNLLDIHQFNGNHEATAQAFKEIGRALYGKFWGPRMEVPFEKVTMALTLANTIRPADTQFTIIDAMNFLLMNNKARIAFLENELPEDNLLKTSIHRYFEYEFDSMNRTFKEQVISPVLSKLRDFESSTQLLAIFAQPQSSFNMSNLVREGKIVLVRTGMSTFSEEFSGFIGSLILNMTKRAVVSQENVPAEKRTPTTIVVDESQLFPGFNFGSSLSGLAKYGGNFFLTSQGTSFLGRASSSDETDRPHAYHQVMSNVATRIVFRLSGHDANIITDTEFTGEMEPGNLVNLPEHQAFIQFSANGNVHGPFLVETAEPIQPNEQVAAAILAGQSRYTIPYAQAIETAKNVLDRIRTYYGSKVSADWSMQDGEAAVTSQSESAISHIIDVEAPDPRHQILTEGNLGLQVLPIAAPIKPKPSDTDDGPSSDGNILDLIPTGDRSQ